MKFFLKKDTQRKILMTQDIIYFGCISESEIPPIALKLSIPTYFDLLITKMTMKIGGNNIFKVKTQKEISFFTFFILPQLILV